MKKSEKSILWENWMKKTREDWKEKEKILSTMTGEKSSSNISKFRPLAFFQKKEYADFIKFF